MPYWLIKAIVYWREGWYQFWAARRDRRRFLDYKATMEFYGRAEDKTH